MDRPTHNSLLYLTSVRPHPITRHPRLVDPYVYESMSFLLGRDAVDAFGEYSRSFYTEEGHYANLWKYDKVITGKPHLNGLQEAIETTRRAFHVPGGVTSIGWNALATVPFIRSSSAGWTYTGKKGDPGNHEEAIRKAVGTLMTWKETRMMHGVERDRFRYTPDMAWTRTQLASLDSPKIRHVWGKAFHNIILEGMSAAPLIAHYQNVCKPIVVGCHLYKALPWIIHSVLDDGDTKKLGIGLDMTSFDTCPMPWLINEAFDICKSNLKFATEEEELAFEFSRQYFIETPVIMPDGRMWLKKLGVPSGSYYTQLIDSIVNHILVNFIQMNVWGRTFETFVLGDDSLFGVPIEFGYPDLDAIERFAAQLGFELSKTKCIITGNPSQLEFLGHTARGDRVHRDVEKMLRLALYPEEPVTGPELSLARVQGLLFDSALNNQPLLDLYLYMEATYKVKPMENFPREDSNWLRAVVGFDIRPSDVDIARIWTLT